MITVKNGEFIIPMTPEGTFDIPVSACNEYVKILAWVIQLTDKSWVTKELLDEFIHTALDHQNLPMPTV